MHKFLPQYRPIHFQDLSLRHENVVFAPNVQVCGVAQEKLTG